MTAGPAPVTFSNNGTNTAQETVATFQTVGSYSLLVTITNAGSYFVTSSVAVMVDPTLTNIVVKPDDPTVSVGGQQQFTASSTDQFGHPLRTSPSYSWSASAGEVSNSGVYSAPAQAASVTVTASADGVQGRKSVSVESATTITVMSATDAALQSAITTANSDAANGQAVTILFAASLAGDTIDVEPHPLALTAGTGAIRIEGGGLISLSGDGTSQVFQIDSGANVTLDGLVVEEGSAGSGNGGGINNAGTLNITNSTFTRNNAGGSGGGIENSGSLNLTNVTVTGNTAGGSGGGVDNEQAGMVSVSGATFSGNYAVNGGAINNAGSASLLDVSFSANTAVGTGALGGAIASAGTLTVTSATLSNNSAGNAGGAIDNGGAMTVTGSTIDDNTAGYIAGGIDNAGTMTVTNTTIAGNTAYQGGGIFNGDYYGESGHLTLSNDTVTTNFAAYGCWRRHLLGGRAVQYDGRQHAGPV